MFDRNERKVSWKAEHDNGIYKVYDWNKMLAAYFFPEYGQIEPEDAQEEAIEHLNKSHATLANGGYLVLPMLKLGLLDNQTAISIEQVIESLQSNFRRAEKWQAWLHQHSNDLSILGVGIHTAREDRNMLSIAISLAGSLTLGDKEVTQFLLPTLNLLHEEELL